MKGILVPRICFDFSNFCCDVMQGCRTLPLAATRDAARATVVFAMTCHRPEAKCVAATPATTSATASMAVRVLLFATHQKITKSRHQHWRALISESFFFHIFFLQ
jgi:hypothetical protein